MARTAYISSPPGFQAVNASTKKQAVELTCEWDYNAADDHVRIGFLCEKNNPPSGGDGIRWYDTSSGKAPGYWRDSYAYSGGGPETMVTDGGTTGSLLRRSTLDCDTTYYSRSCVDYWLDYDETTRNARVSGVISFKTYPIPFVCNPLAAAATAFNAGEATFIYYPNTVESTATVSLQYKRTVDSTWITVESYTGQSGYGAVTKSNRPITGLTGSTSYDVRVIATRTTSSDTTYASSTVSFTTPAGVPRIDTLAATSVGFNGATLRARVYNDLLPVDITFEWSDDPDAPPYANETSPPQNVTVVTGDGYSDVSVAISGLSEGTQYFFRAKATYGGGSTLVDDELNFTTATDPGPLAAAEEHMQTIQFDGQYGQAKTFNFTLRAPASGGGASSDLYYTGVVPEQGDCTIYHTNAAGTVSVQGAAADNAIEKTGTFMFTLVLSNAEMSAETIDVIIHDADATTFRDAHIQVRTAQRLSELDIDATAGPSNVSALTAIGNGSGHGILATGGATGNDIDAIIASQFLRVGAVGANGSGTNQKLDAAASGDDDFYNGAILMIIGGVGAGQARVINDYVGSSQTAVIDTAWVTNPTTAGNSIYAIVPGARPWDAKPEEELQAVPDPDAKFGEMLQLVFQRFAFKITQNGTTQEWFKSDGTSLATRTVGDTGTEQTVDILA